MAGLLDSLINGGGGPSLNVASLDPGTSKLIQTSNDRANGDIQGQMNAGVGSAGQSAQQGNQSLNQEAASTGQNEGMLKAIRNQYGKAAGQNINDIVQGNQENAPVRQSQMLAKAHAAAMAQMNVQTQNYEALANASNAAEAARANLLSGIFGAGGAVAGAAMSGRKKAPGAFDNYQPTSSPAGANGSSYGNMSNQFTGE